MASDIEIWFDTAPAPAAVAIALERFGALHEMKDGLLRLVEGDEAPEEGLPLVLVEVATPPEKVRRFVPSARATLKASAVMAGGRGFWMARMAAEIQRHLGGVVYLPSSDEAYGDVESFEKSIPEDPHAHEAPEDGWGSESSSGGPIRPQGRK